VYLRHRFFVDSKQLSSIRKHFQTTEEMFRRLLKFRRSCHRCQQLQQNHRYRTKDGAGDKESYLAGRGSRPERYAARRIVPFPLVDWGMSPPSTPAMPFDDPFYLPRGHSAPPSSASSLIVESRDLDCQLSLL